MLGMTTTSVEELKAMRTDPCGYGWKEYFASRPDVFARFNEPKTIVDVFPQAVDSEHPFHDGFWNMLFYSPWNMNLSDEDLEVLQKEMMRLNEEGGEAKRERARVVSEKYADWNDW